LTIIDKLTNLFKTADASKSGFVNKRFIARQILKDKSLYKYFNLKRNHKSNQFLDYYGPSNNTSFTLNEFLTAF